jgi:hypothetical protein
LEYRTGVEEYRKRVEVAITVLGPVIALISTVCRAR